MAAQRAGWEMLPPRDRVQKRSSVDRVAGLSAHARLWLGPDMVQKGKKRAAAPVNSQKKKKKKGIDCWDMMDIIADGSNSSPTASSVPEWWQTGTLHVVRQRGGGCLKVVLVSQVIMIELGWLTR